MQAPTSKEGEPVIVDGAYNLPEGPWSKPMPARKRTLRTRSLPSQPAEKTEGPGGSPAEMKRSLWSRMSRSACPHAVSLNLVARARPYFGLIVLTTSLLTAFGLVAMLRMPSGIYPEVAFPRIVVIAQTPGLGVKDVEVAVTRPIEEVVSIVLGVVRVRSKSVRGASQLESLRLRSPAGDMVFQALNDVRARMAEVGAQLPAGTSTITERQTPSVFPIISFVVTGGRDPSALHDYAYYDLRPRISRIPDVSYVTVQGGDIREILIEVDLEALVAANLSIADVADRLAKEHRLKAVGRPLRVTALNSRCLPTHWPSIPIDLEDRGDRREERSIDPFTRPRPRHGPGTKIAPWRFGPMRKDAVALTVFRRLGGNALAVSSALEGVLASAATSAPPGVAIRPVYDQGLLVKTAIANVRDAIIIGGLDHELSPSSCLFLKSLRATLICRACRFPSPSSSPSCFLYLTGDTLNLMSLGGLTIGDRPDHRRYRGRDRKYRLRPPGRGRVWRWSDRYALSREISGAVIEARR